MFKTATVALFVGATSAYSLQNLFSVKASQEDIKEFMPLLLELMADPEL